MSLFDTSFVCLFALHFFKTHQMISQVRGQVLVGPHGHGPSLGGLEVLCGSEINHAALPLRRYSVRIPGEGVRPWAWASTHLGSICCIAACASSGVGGCLALPGLS